MANRQGLAALRVFDGDVAVQTTTWRPAAFDSQFTRLYDSDEVVQNPVRDRLVENSFVAESLQVHFKTLQLHTYFVGNVSKNDGPVVRLASFWTNRSKLGAIVLDREVAVGGGVFKDF